MDMKKRSAHHAAHPFRGITVVTEGHLGHLTLCHGTITWTA